MIGIFLEKVPLLTMKEPIREQFESLISKAVHGVDTLMDNMYNTPSDETSDDINLD